MGFLCFKLRKNHFYSFEKSVIWEFFQNYLEIITCFLKYCL
ncbi:hypothetical protein JJD26997_0675 [Campylobacter jejuni subsp. doylei 269.97]|uniref:Uncharacterized protein n=1 Tax=Campylobacter jejuni subsp. doylei (strain ATCC BAA-1458 / RM4099 / 269.97) TaxID=360109 RepID=A7H2U9_CAMJD|nr:hypothetical protein JJD26997_0675 [Campylobacter jejuni subsp. doylei 269.97]